MQNDCIFLSDFVFPSERKTYSGILYKIGLWGTKFWKTSSINFLNEFFFSFLGSLYCKDQLEPNSFYLEMFVHHHSQWNFEGYNMMNCRHLSLLYICFAQFCFVYGSFVLVLYWVLTVNLGTHVTEITCGDWSYRWTDHRSCWNIYPMAFSLHFHNWQCGHWGGWSILFLPESIVLVQYHSLLAYIHSKSYPILHKLFIG